MNEWKKADLGPDWITDYFGPDLSRKIPDPTPEELAQREQDRTNRYQKYLDSWKDPDSMLQYAEQVPIENLKYFREYDRKPGEKDAVMDEDQWNQLRDSIAQHGVTSPLYLEYHPESQTAKLSEGNHRLKAAEEAGLTHVPVIGYRRSQPSRYRMPGYTPHPERLDTDAWGQPRWPQYIRPSDMGLPVRQVNPKQASLPKTKKCKFCKEQATHRVVWAEGMGYVPCCDKHIEKAKAAIDDPSDIVGVQKWASDYRMQHQVSDDSIAMSDPALGTEVMPDFYTRPELYDFGNDADFSQVADTIIRAKGNPEMPVTIYRGIAPIDNRIPEHGEQINTGDWVSLSHEYARHHAMHYENPDFDGPVLSATVPAKTLLNEGYPMEWAYYGPPIASQVMKTSNVLDQVHSGLDPDVFDRPNDIDPEVKPHIREWVKKTIYDAIKDAGWPDPWTHPYVSLVLTGSLCTYQYTANKNGPSSDFDCSVWIDSNQMPDWVRAELIAALVYKLNGTLVPGTTHVLETYIVPPGIHREDLYKVGVRSAYDLDEGVWIVLPDKSLTVDVRKQMPELITYGKMIVDKVRLLLKYNPKAAAQVVKRVQTSRREQMAAGASNLCPANIAWKMLDEEGLEQPGLEAVKKYLHHHAKTASQIQYHVDPTDWGVRIVATSPESNESALGHDHLVGWLELEKDDTDDWKIADVRTLPEFQRRGIATGLLTYAREWAGDTDVNHDWESMSTMGRQWANKVGMPQNLDTWYHGTTPEMAGQVSDLGHFPADYQSAKAVWGPGVYVTDDPKETSRFGPNQLSVGIGQANMLDVSDEPWGWGPITVAENVLTPELLHQFQENTKYTPERGFSADYGLELRKCIEALGYDGLIYRGDNDNRWAVIFHPEMVQRLSALQPVMYHVSPTSARESILAHGLDIEHHESIWSNDEYEEGNYLWDSPERAIEYSQPPSSNSLWDDAYGKPTTMDVWSVDVQGLNIQKDMSGVSEVEGAFFTTQTIPANRLTLLGTTDLGGYRQSSLSPVKGMIFNVGDVVWAVLDTPHTTTANVLVKNTQTGEIRYVPQSELRDLRYPPRIKKVKPEEAVQAPQEPSQMELLLDDANFMYGDDPRHASWEKSDLFSAKGWQSTAKTGMARWEDWEHRTEPHPSLRFDRRQPHEMTPWDFAHHPDTHWHATPSGKMGDGVIHFGTQKAAYDALTANLAGGNASHLKWHPHEPLDKLRNEISTPENAWMGGPKDWHTEPTFIPVRVAPHREGDMQDVTDMESEYGRGDIQGSGDEYANTNVRPYSQVLLDEGDLEGAAALHGGHGYWYTNEAEDPGSVSGVVPHKSWLWTHEDFVRDALEHGADPNDFDNETVEAYPHLFASQRSPSYERLGIAMQPGSPSEGWYPRGMMTVYRGLSIATQDTDEETLSDLWAMVREKGQQEFVRYVLEGQPAGIHWTDDESVAQRFALPDGDGIGIVLEAEVDSAYAIDPLRSSQEEQEWGQYAQRYEIHERGNDFGGSQMDEQEVTIRKGAPINLNAAYLVYEGTQSYVPLSMQIVASKESS